jgi:Tfp pilus assembly protein PilN
VNTKLNLASKPFSNRTLPWVITSLITILSVASFIFIVKSTGDTNAQSAQLQRDIRSFKEEQDAIQKKADVVKESMTAEQLASLRAAHELVDRKRFSWSRLFIDLENALPGSVRVTRISVRDVATQGEQTVAELDLAVVAKSAATITDMISEMDRGGVFQAELRSQNLQKGRGETGTEYELIVEYRPRAGSPASDAQASNLAASQRPDLMEEKR